MVRISLLVVALGLAPWLLAEGKKEKKAEAKPNTLTAKEIADGRVLLFDGETTFGWKVKGEVKVENGTLVLGGTKATTLTSTTSLGYGTWRMEAKSTKEPGFITVHGKLRMPAPSDKPWASVSIERTSAEDTGRPIKSPFPVELSVDAGGTFSIRNFRFRPSTPTQLFNGKDLSGWKVFKGNPKQEKSKFTVTKEGWLNVKDGPGDLQTTRTFGDFVLQLECISNGTRLNSGVFFRAIPGKYQQGYEAQVHNGWLDKPKAITVDDYDPKEKKAINRKVETTAMDFGTGAIYRRQPARRAVAKDKEWFAMTVIANGRHFATWVNGVQQVDWSDHRPGNDNPRQGYRAKAGAISIQGHDPTTDLSFRNVRAGALP